FTRMHEWFDVIDLDYKIPEMRLEMISSMKHWVTEYDIDGFRCDMARTVPLDFWIEVRSECDTIKPLFWLAECEVWAFHEAFDLIYGWECMRTLDKFFKGEIDFEKIEEVLVKYSHSPVGSGKLLFTSNHDENTYWGTEYEKYGTSAHALAIFSCTFPGIPLIYSGQEKPNHKRLSFFEKDHIDWEGEIELHNFYKTLLKLRKRNKALEENASVLLLKSDAAEVIAYLCRRETDRLLVILNLSRQAKEIKINHPAIAGEYMNVFGDKPVKVNREETFQLDPGGYVLYTSPLL
ncbi:MAG: 1,4-alpha-glucan branching protein, partial [Sphingobacteriales bacterium]